MSTYCNVYSMMKTGQLFSRSETEFMYSMLDQNHRESKEIIFPHSLLGFHLWLLVKVSE